MEEALKLIEGQRSSTAPKIKIMPDMPSVYGDRLRLVEVVQNLLDNAIKFSSQSEDPCIEVGARTENRETIFYVQDNGIGIASWQEANRPGSHGLTIMRERAEAFGGNLKVSSVPGKGTKVEANIPIEIGDQENIQKENQE